MRSLVRVPLVAFLLAASLPTSGLGQILPVPLGTSPEEVEIFGFFRPNVTLLPNGRFATVWTRGGKNGSFPGDVYLQIVHANGSRVFESPGRAVTTSPFTEGDAVVAAHAQEGVLVDRKSVV